nr:ribonuclease H-like domain-containing protein [Tanacetum cinerariifolium]
MTDYSLWEVILNGDSHIPTRVVDGVVQPVAPTTAKQRLAKKNELKARGTLLLALPDKHQLNFNIHKDAKSLMEAIEKRFGGNKEIKKILINQLEVLGESLSQEDINLEFLKSLPTEWRTHTLIWKNKTDLEDQSLDDLFNKLNIYEAEYTVVTSVSIASTKVPVSTLPNVDNLSDVVIYSFFSSQSNSPQLDNDDLKQIDVNDLEEMNLKWQMAMLTIRARRKRAFCKGVQRNVPLEISTSNALVSQCDGVGSYDWSFQADEEPTNYGLMAFTSLSSSKPRKKFKKAKQERDELRLKLENFQTSSKNLCKLLASQINDKTRLGYDNQVFNSTVFDYDALISSESDVSILTSPVLDRYKSGEGYHDVPPPYTGMFMPPKPDLVFYDTHTINEIVLTILHVEPKDKSEGEPMPTQKAHSFVHTSEHVKTHRLFDKPVEHPIPAKNLRKDILKSRGHTHSWNRKACFVCKSLTHLIKDCDYYRKQMVQKPGNPHHALKNKGVIDSEIQKVVRSQEKGKIWTGKLDFDDVYFVKELKFNLFSVSLMCDKKNNVLFTNTECIVLSSDFKFLDENHVLLRVPKENNMYNLDLKNIVPLGDLTWNQPNSSASIQEHFVADKAGEGNVQQYVLFTLWFTGSKDPQNTNADATFKVKKPESEVHVSLSSSDKTKKHNDKTKREAKGKNMPTLEDITYLDDEEDVGAEADFSNLETDITVNKKSASALIDTKKPLFKDPDGEDVHVHTYRVDTPLFDGMLVPQQVQDDDVAATTKDEDAANELSAEPTPPSPIPITTPPPQQELIPSPSQVESTPPPSPHQSPIETCATLTKKVGTLEQDKIAQDIEITKLKQRVRRLEKKRKLKASGFKRLRKVGTAQRVESSADTVIDDQEDGRLEEYQAHVYHLDLEHAQKVLEVVTTSTTTITDALVPKASALRKRT